jgi:uncharacterized membrane protein
MDMNQPIKVEKTVTINKPVEELYRFWHNFENLPHFMKHLKEVKVYNDKRSHWTISGPLDGTVEWDADITEARENELIAWTSVEGADVSNSGFIQTLELGLGKAALQQTIEQSCRIDS